MLRLTALSLVLASLASAADVNDLEACDGGDLEACRRAAHRAERKREFTLARELRQRAQALEKLSMVKESAASAPEPAARASKTEDLGLARTVPLVEAVPTWPAEGMEPLLALPESGVPPEPPLAAPDTSPGLAVPPPRLEPVPGTEVRSEHVEAPSHRGSFGSRLGFLAVGGGEVLTTEAGNTGGRLRGGVGLRLALTPRAGREGEVLPSVALLGGGVGGSTEPAFFLETRMELLVTSTRNIAQSRFTLYGLTGLEFHGRPQAYVGLGLGWNWLPKGGGGHSGNWGGLGSWVSDPRGLVVLAAAAIVGLGIAAFVLAGRIEFRFLPSFSPFDTARAAPLTQPGAPHALAFMFGLGA